MISHVNRATVNNLEKKHIFFHYCLQIRCADSLNKYVWYGNCRNGKHCCLSFT